MALPTTKQSGSIAVCAASYPSMISISAAASWLLIGG
jgi:hypothetical protein